MRRVRAWSSCSPRRTRPGPPARRPRTPPASGPRPAGAPSRMRSRRSTSSPTGPDDGGGAAGLPPDRVSPRQAHLRRVPSRLWAGHGRHSRDTRSGRSGAERPKSDAAMIGPILLSCVSREFAVFTDRTSPVVGWLRALAAHAHAECGGPGVGAVGMCFTGGFALAMAVDAAVLAPVLAFLDERLRPRPG